MNAQDLKEQLSAWRATLGGGTTADRLLDLPPVRAAIASGTAHKVYGAFRKARRGTLPRTERELIDHLLARRRLFAEPVQSAPPLTRVNGIGMTLVGRSEADADGTYVATRCLSLLFVPLVPFDAYVVEPAGPNAWHFLGRVPSAPWQRAWRACLLALGVLAALALGYAKWQAGRHARVDLINALDVPVDVTLGGKTHRVGPGARIEVQAAVGRTSLSSSTDAGALLETLEVDVPGDKDVVAYNVLGAAPLVFACAIYAPETAKPREPRPPTLLVGRSWVVLDGVEFRFVDLPDKIRAQKTTGGHERCAVLVAGDWRVGLEMLLEKEGMPRAIALAERVALASLTRASIEAAGEFLVANAPEVAARFAEEAVQRTQGSIEAHRVLQDALDASSRHGDALTRYRAAHAKEPTSSRATYLLARLLPPREALALAGPALAQAPDDSWLLRLVSWTHAQLGGYAEAAQAMEHLLQQHPEDEAEHLDLHVRVLVGAGRLPEALARVERHLGDGQLGVFVLHTMLQRLATPDRTLDALRPHVRQWIGGDGNLGAALAEIAARARDRKLFERHAASLEDPNLLIGYRLIVEASHDLEKAADTAATLGPEVIASLDDLTALLIAAELLRTDREVEAKRIHDSLPPDSRRQLPLEMLRTPPTELDALDLSFECKALLAQAASRRATDAAERERLLDLARRYDVLQNVLPAR